MALLYADDLVVIAETEDDIITRLNDWKYNVEFKGMRVNMDKTKENIGGNLFCVELAVKHWLN